MSKLRAITLVIEPEARLQLYVISEVIIRKVTQIQTAIAMLAMTARDQVDKWGESGIDELSHASGITSKDLRRMLTSSTTSFYERVTEARRIDLVLYRAPVCGRVTCRIRLRGRGPRRAGERLPEVQIRIHDDDGRDEVLHTYNLDVSIAKPKR